MAEIFDLQVRCVVKTGERGWHHPIAPLFTLVTDKRIVGKRLALAQCAVALAFDPFTADGQVLHGMPVIRARIVLLQPNHLCHAWVLGQWGRSFGVPRLRLRYCCYHHKRKELMMQIKK